MTDDATRATLDRIVDGERAVLLLEDDAGAVADELAVDVADLPSDGRHEGAVFDVTVTDGELREAVYRPDATQQRRSTAQDRLDRLSSRFGDDGDEEPE